MKSTVWTLIGVVAVMACLAADVQAQGPRGYGQNGFYYSGKYGQFYPPIYSGPRVSTGGFTTTAPGRSQYQYNTPQYGTGAILQQNNRSTYIPNGGGYGYPAYGYGGQSYGYQGYGGSPAYGYNSGNRSRASYRYGW